MALGLKCPECGHNAFKMVDGRFSCVWCGVNFASEPQPPEPKSVRGTLEYVGEQVRVLRLHMERCHKKLAVLERSLTALAEPAQPTEETKNIPASAGELQPASTGTAVKLRIDPWRRSRVVRPAARDAHEAPHTAPPEMEGEARPPSR